MTCDYCQRDCEPEDMTLHKGDYWLCDECYEQATKDDAINQRDAELEDRQLRKTMGTDK